MKPYFILYLSSLLFMILCDQDDCPEYCEKCDDDNNICLECKNKNYYGINCDIECNKERKNCITCDIEGKCLSCTDNKFYGPNCTDSCENCPTDCNMEGICSDSSTNCKNDLYYGTKCEIDCNKDRKDCITCDRKGECLSCTNKTIFGPNCTDSCENCPTDCNMEGTCSDSSTNCKNNLFYGTKCEIDCNKDRPDCITCDRNGKCLSCKDNKFYGPNCTDSCENCPTDCNMEGTCNDSSSNCKNNLFYGTKCEIPCNKDRKNCETCDRNGNCLSCTDNNFYGLNCTDSCQNCPSGCKKDNGICFDSSSNCKNNLYYDTKCDKKCNEPHSNCTTCNREGECLTCKNNQTYGKYCEIQCSIGCEINDKNEKQCFQDGRCKEGCLYNYFGSLCDEKCDGCLGKGCDDQGYCKEFKCQNGTYGLKCDGICSCRNNSNSLECGKFSSECLNCKFGYFGKDCQKKCNYKCKTGLCCIFKEEQLSSRLKINTNYRYLKVTIGDKEYKVEIDYNYGFPLTLFNSSIKIDCKNINNITIEKIKGEKGPNSNYHFTNYDINGFLYKNSSINIDNNNIENVDLIIASTMTCKKNYDGVQDIDGVIGLGFFNSISNALFLDKLNELEQNLLSYSINKDNKNNIDLLFGTMSEEQINFIEKLTSCEVIFSSDTDIQGKKMTCELYGMKSSKHSKALKLNNSTITFSLGQNSSFILKYEQRYKEYLENEYFNGESEIIKDNKGIQYFLIDKDKINKLPNFGLLINNFYYSYEPDKFFKNELENGKKRFLIEFSDEIDKTEFILGKEFLEDIKFTINNEEAKIYFYAQNAEYLDYSNVIEDYNKERTSFKTQLEAREIAAICLAIIIFINLCSFVIYFFIKKKRINSNNYIKID